MIEVKHYLCSLKKRFIKDSLNLSVVFNCVYTI
jgi:hypothetical protein